MHADKDLRALASSLSSIDDLLANGPHENERGQDRGIDGDEVLVFKRHGIVVNLVLRPNVRAKLAPTAWRAGQQAQNGPKAQRLMASAACRWRSA